MATSIGSSSGFGLGVSNRAHGSGQQGFAMANRLQHDDWQRDVMRQSAVRRALRAAGASDPARVYPPHAGRVSAALGGVLVRLGTRLQGGTQATAPAPAR